MKCPKCQAENPNIQKFCSQCGAKLEKVCLNCGGINPPEYKFCGDCGSELRLPAQFSTEAHTAVHTFGKNPGSPPRNVSIRQTLRHCPAWLLGIFFPTPFILMMSLYGYLEFQSKFALWTGFAPGAYLLFSFIVFWKQRITLTNGEAILGHIISVKSYDRGAGYLSFANYKAISYSYDQGGKTYSEKWMAKPGLLEKKKPSAGDNLWLIADKKKKNKSFVWDIS